MSAIVGGHFSSPFSSLYDNSHCCTSAAKSRFENAGSMSRLEAVTYKDPAASHTDDFRSGALHVLLPMNPPGQAPSGKYPMR